MPKVIPLLLASMSLVGCLSDPLTAARRSPDAFWQLGNMPMTPAERLDSRVVIGIVQDLAGFRAYSNRQVANLSADPPVMPQAWPPQAGWAVPSIESFIDQPDGFGSLVRKFTRWDSPAPKDQPASKLAQRAATPHTYEFLTLTFSPAKSLTGVKHDYLFERSGSVDPREPDLYYLSRSDAEMASGRRTSVACERRDRDNAANAWKAGVTFDGSPADHPVGTGTIDLPSDPDFADATQYWTVAGSDTRIDVDPIRAQTQPLKWTIWIDAGGQLKRAQILRNGEVIAELGPDTAPNWSMPTYQPVASL